MSFLFPSCFLPGYNVCHSIDCEPCVGSSGRPYRHPLFSPLPVHPTRAWFNEMTLFNREGTFSVKDSLVVLLLQTNKWIFSRLAMNINCRSLSQTSLRSKNIYSCLTYPFRSLCLFLLQEVIALWSSIYTNQAHILTFTFLVLHIHSYLFSPFRNSRSGFILLFINKLF